MPADRRRRRRSTSSSSSSGSSEERRAKRKARRKATGNSLWGAMDAPGFKGGMVPEGAAKGGRSGITFMANPGSDAALAEAAMREAAECGGVAIDDDGMKLSGSQAKIALMHKLQQRTEPGQAPTAPLVMPPRAERRQRATNPDLVNPLMAGPGRKNMSRKDNKDAKTTEPVTTNSFAKRQVVWDIPKEKWGLLIGKGGANYSAVTARYGVELKIPTGEAESDGKVRVRGSQEGVEGIKREFEALLGTSIQVLEDTTTDSRVMALSNMVSQPEDIDDGLVESIRKECLKFGPVSNAAVYDEHQHDGAVISKVLIKFQYPTSIVRCLGVMNGRLFDGRRVKAEYFCEDTFESIVAS